MCVGIILYFFTQNNMYWDASAIHEKQEYGFVKWNEGTLLHVVLLVATKAWHCVLLVAPKRHRLNVGFQHL